MEKDGEDRTAHVVSLDLGVDDSTVMTFTWPWQPREKGGVNRGSGRFLF